MAGPRKALINAGCVVGSQYERRGGSRPKVSWV